MSDPDMDCGLGAWEIEHGVTCVVCPGCAFTFAAYHTDDRTGRYSCPNCPTPENVDSPTTDKKEEQ